MPKVNGKKYSYTEEGVAAAKKAAKKSGESMNKSKAANMYCAKGNCK
jgi:hypothetical protein